MSLQANTHHKTVAYIFVAVFLVGTDRFLKVAAINNLFLEPKKIIGNFVQLVFEKNPHIAFSLPLGGVFLNLAIILMLVGLMVHANYLFKTKQKEIGAMISIIILGASSNLFDRLKYGFVIDYVDVRYFTVFNLADFTILLGVLLILLNKRKVHAILRVLF
ncbi:MAG: signal peptidase II [Candidatus Falkowbacteria bacterium]|nr:signal peptidase II [Candidatus Falkowbacteria bacterium]